MPIRRSSAVDVDRLMAELSSADDLRRQTAQARLAVIGARAVTKLCALALDDNEAGQARLAAIQSLEAIGDPRSLGPAATLAERNDEIGLSAIAVLGAIVRLKEARATRAFDRLAALVLDQETPDERRLAALAALEGLSERLLKPIYDALAADRNPRLSARATRRAVGATIPLETLLECPLPDDPGVVAAVIREEVESAKVTTLRRAVEAVRARERAVEGERRAVWTAIRGQVHQALAARTSRLALYDLRETLEHAGGPLPVGFLAAAAVIGDNTCLEPLAAAWVHAAPEDHWWRDHLADAFRAIVTREHLGRRHQVVRRILDRWPAAGVLVPEARRA
jgi:hypothetical protein